MYKQYIVFVFVVPHDFEYFTVLKGSGVHVFFNNAT